MANASEPIIQNPALIPPPDAALYDAITLKAYFIALDRHARGEPADPLKDWLEAERQIKGARAESTIARNPAGE